MLCMLLRFTHLHIQEVLTISRNIGHHMMSCFCLNFLSTLLNSVTFLAIGQSTPRNIARHVADTSHSFVCARSQCVHAGPGHSVYMQVIVYGYSTMAT